MSTWPRDQRLRVGLLGAGVVGRAVIELLQVSGAALGLELRRIAVRAPERRRPGLPESVPIGSVEDMLHDSEVDVVVDVLGGLDPAVRAVRAALELGKHAVSANEELLGAYGEAFEVLARSRGVQFRHRGVVSGSFALELIEAGVIADRVDRLSGVLSPTAAFVLGRARAASAPVESALHEARRAGTAPADASRELSGAATAVRLAALVRASAGGACSPDDIPIIGVEAIALDDHRAAFELGATIQLLGAFTRKVHGFDVRVAPTLVPAHSPLGRVNGAEVAVEVAFARVGAQVVVADATGPAGTAAGVMRDLAHIARTGRTEPAAAATSPIWEADTLDLPRTGDLERSAGRPGPTGSVRVLPAELHRARWLVRLPGENRAVPASHIGAVFAAHDIEVLKLGRSATPGVGTLIVSAEVEAVRIAAVLDALETLPGTVRPPVVLAMHPALSAG